MPTGYPRVPTQYDSMQGDPSGVSFDAPPPPPPPKQRAVPVETLEDGTIRYSDDSVRRPNGQLAQIHPAGNHNLFTRENAAASREKRQAATGRKTRKAIAAVMSKKLGREVATGSEAIAEATAQLFDQIVVNPKDGVRAGDRTRMLVTAAQISETALLEPERSQDGGVGIQLHMNLGGEISERVRQVLIKRMGGLPGEVLPASGLPGDGLPGGGLPASSEDQRGDVVDGQIVE